MLQFRSHRTIPILCNDLETKNIFHRSTGHWKPNFFAFLKNEAKCNFQGQKEAYLVRPSDHQREWVTLGFLRWQPLSWLTFWQLSRSARKAYIFFTFYRSIHEFSNPFIFVTILCYSWHCSENSVKWQPRYQKTLFFYFFRNVGISQNFL